MGDPESEDQRNVRRRLEDSLSSREIRYYVTSAIGINFRISMCQFQAHIGGLAAKPVPYPAAAAAPVTAIKAEVLRRGVMSCLDGVLKQVMMDQDHDDKIASGG